ncbi:MAG: M1 family aminopeptidase, partial [Bacteroidota bacterium]
FLELLPFLVIYTIAAFFFQSITNSKFIGMITTAIFFIIDVLFTLFVSDHILLNFAGGSLPIFSDMNGYGHLLKPYLLGKIYWLIFSLFLLIAASILKQSGTETKLSKRWRSGWIQSTLRRSKLVIVGLILFVSTGSFIFYNTNILNEYWTEKEKNSFRATYEKHLKPFEYLPQPKVVSVDLNLELYPSKRAYEVKGIYQLVNTSAGPIQAIHLQKQIETDTHWKDVHFDRTVALNDEYSDFHYYIYELEKPLLPNDTIQFNFTQYTMPKGFENKNSNTDILHNGTFFNNDLFPTLGYRRKYELQDDDIRKSYGLASRKSKAKIDDPKELVNTRSGSDSDGITLDMVIGTEKPQTVVTSGNLVRQWSTDSRNYFHYKSNQKIINFYSIVSAHYRVKKDRHVPLGNSLNDAVELEIYHHETHTYNLDRMLEAMKYSLDYYSTQFGAYPFQQVRIMEFPRYRKFAQSFPNAIPFSEALGFVMDIDDAKDVDMVFFITAHELAHQWWGCQLGAANVEGRYFVLETLAQYSAMMVLKEKYGIEKVEQFLAHQYDDYVKGMRQQKIAEPPLMLVGKEEHIYYNKGALCMYALQEEIGETQVNAALQTFFQDWKNFNNPKRPNRYATSQDLISYFRAVSPEDAQELITKLFEEVHEIDEFGEMVD